MSRKKAKEVHVDRTFGIIAPEDEARIQSYFSDILNSPIRGDTNTYILRDMNEFAMNYGKMREESKWSSIMVRKVKRFANRAIDLATNPLAREELVYNVINKAARTRNRVLNYYKTYVYEPITYHLDDGVDYFTHASRPSKLVPNPSYNKETTVEDVAKNLKLKGKTAIITGGTSEIGQEVARGLLLSGARVILLTRNPIKSNHVVHKLREETGIEEIYYSEGVFNSYPQVVKAVSEIKSREIYPDILINMAAQPIDTIPQFNTFGEFGSTFGVSFVGPYLFTEMMLNRLTQIDPKRTIRIINVTCGAHKYTSHNIEHLSVEKAKDFTGLPGYSFAKLLNVAHVIDMDNRLKKAGVRTISINAVNPGWADTDLFKDSYVLTPFRLGMKYLGLLKRPEVAAAPILYLAGDDALNGVSGRYFESFYEKYPIRKVAWRKFQRHFEEFTWEMTDIITMRHEDQVLREVVKKLNPSFEKSKKALGEFIQERVNVILDEKKLDRKNYLKTRLEENGVGFQDLLPKDIELPIDLSKPLTEKGPNIYVMFKGTPHQSEVYVPPYEELIAGREDGIGPKDAPVPIERMAFKQNAGSVNTRVKTIAKKWQRKKEEEDKYDYENQKEDKEISYPIRYQQLLYKMEQQRIIDNEEQRQKELSELTDTGLRKTWKTIWNALTPYK